jgi:hypothetical protein
MSLDLSPDQPAEVAHVPPLATVVTTDAVIVRITEAMDGALTIAPGSNRAALTFDRFQANAIREALGVEVK